MNGQNNNSRFNQQPSNTQMNQNNNINNIPQTPLNNNTQIPPSNQKTVEVLNNTQNSTISQVSPPPMTPNINIVTEQVQTANKTPLEDNKKKEGYGKQIILFIFLIALIVFVFFLPDISKFVQSARGTTSNEELRTGTLVCTMEQEDDTTALTYKMYFNYIDNKLRTSTLTITQQDENDANINTKYKVCQNMSTISENITGISVECRPSENLLITTETYEHQTIDKNNLTKFTEAGGTYPEFDYQEDVNTIRDKMKKNGYDCKDE